MVFSPAISALQRSLGAGKALTAAHVKVREVDGVEADMELDTCNVKYDNKYKYDKTKSTNGLLDCYEAKKAKNSTSTACGRK